MQLSTETLGEHTHQVLSCRSAYGLAPARDLLAAAATQDRTAGLRSQENPRVIPGRLSLRRIPSQGAGSGDHVFRGVVPAGHYLMIGDNRDNSEDSRSWVYVPDQNLVGKATRIWFNFDLQRSSLGQLGSHRRWHSVNVIREGIMRKQRGVTMIGWIFLLVPVAIVLYAGIRVGPEYLNYYKVVTAMKETATQLKSDETLNQQIDPERRSAKRFDTGYIDKPDGKDIILRKGRRTAGRWTADYETAVPLFGNLNLLMAFKKTVVIN